MSAWISPKNWLYSENAELTASGEAGDLLVSNLKGRYGYRMWRDDSLTEGDPSSWFQVDFGSVREVGVLLLLFPRSNLPGSYDLQAAFADDDTIRHRLDADTPAAGALLDTGAVASGVVPGYGYHVHKLATPVSARYWRCDLSAPSRAALGYVDLARAWAGPVLQPEVGVDYGATHGWNATNPIVASASGDTDFVGHREAKRSFSMTFSWLTASERDAIEDLEREVTTAGQFIACRDDLSLVRGTMIAMQQKSAGLQAVAAHLRHQKSFLIVESY